jgi:hypothetical protein
MEREEVAVKTKILIEMDVAMFDEIEERVKLLDTDKSKYIRALIRKDLLKGSNASLELISK